MQWRRALTRCQIRQVRENSVAHPVEYQRLESSSLPSSSPPSSSSSTLPPEMPPISANTHTTETAIDINPTSVPRATVPEWKIHMAGSAITTDVKNEISCSSSHYCTTMLHVGAINRLLTASSPRARGVTGTIRSDNFYHTFLKTWYIPGFVKNPCGRVKVVANMEQCIAVVTMSHILANARDDIKCIGNQWRYLDNWLFKVNVIAYGSLKLKKKWFWWNNWTPFSVNSTVFRRADSNRHFSKAYIQYFIESYGALVKSVAWWGNATSAALHHWSWNNDIIWWRAKDIPPMDSTQSKPYRYRLLLSYPNSFTGQIFKVWLMNWLYSAQYYYAIAQDRLCACEYTVTPSVHLLVFQLVNTSQLNTSANWKQIYNIGLYVACSLSFSYFWKCYFHTTCEFFRGGGKCSFSLVRLAVDCYSLFLSLVLFFSSKINMYVCIVNLFLLTIAGTLHRESQN